MSPVLEKIIEYGIYLFVFLLPWQTRWIWHQGYLVGGKWEYGSFSLYATDIILFILMVLSLFGTSKVYKKIGNVLVPVIGIVVITFLSFLGAGEKDVALYSFARLAGGVILLWIILKNKFSWHKIGIAFISAGFIQGIFAIYQFFNQGFDGSKWLGIAAQSPGVSGTIVVETASGRFLRAYGSLPHPNLLAGFLLVCLFVLIAFYFNFYIKVYSEKKYTARNVFKLFLILSTFIVISFGFILTFSRITILAFVIGLFFLWLTFLFRKNKQSIFLLAKITTVFVLCGMVIVLIFPDVFLTRILAQERLEVYSSEQRSQYLSEAARLFEKNWLTGVGIGNYTSAIYNQINADKKAQDYQPVHNIYLLIADEIGIVGIIVFLLLILEILKNTWQKIDLREKFSIDDNWFLIFSVSFLCLLIISLFDHYFWTLSFGIWLFWLVLGLQLKASQEI